MDGHRECFAYVLMKLIPIALDLIYSKVLSLPCYAIVFIMMIKANKCKVIPGVVVSIFV